MTARGTYNCPGENVYLWKNADDTFEYVPAVGGAGAAITSAYKRTLSGNTGGAGYGRRTGGGGSGGASVRSTSRLTAHGGAGSSGTSYSGGSGGGGAALSSSSDCWAGSGAANGGAGGYRSSW